MAQLSNKPQNCSVLQKN